MDFVECRTTADCDCYHCNEVRTLARAQAFEEAANVRDVPTPSGGGGWRSALRERSRAEYDKLTHPKD